MGGYYSAMKSLATIDARYVVRNSKIIATYCRTARNETLMSASFGCTTPPLGGPLDLSAVRRS